MRKNSQIINFIIVLEVIVLILVLVFSALSFVTSGKGLGSLTGGSGSQETGDAMESADSSADAAVDDDTASDTSGGDEGTLAETVPDTYEEDRLTFSDEVEELLTSLTTEQLVAQLFVTTPEELTGVDAVTVAGDGTQSAIESYPVAGLVYSAQNFSSSSKTQELLEGTQAFSQDVVGLDLFLIIEELGGENASPVADANGYEIEDSPASLASDGDADAVSDAAAARAAYLASDGFTTVFGPYADLSDDLDTVYGTSDAELTEVAEYVAADVAAILAEGLDAIVRAFPGVDTAADNYAVYEAALDAGAGIVQTANVFDEDLTGSGTTLCSLSAGTVTALREDLGFDGVIMTADLAGAADETTYSVGEAAVQALLTGSNLLYVTDGFEDAYDAVLSAVESGEISQTMLENAVGRILTQKLG